MKLTDLLTNKKIDRFQAPVPRPFPVIPLSSFPDIARILIHEPWVNLPFDELRTSFDIAMRLASNGESPRAVIEARLGRYAEPFLDALSRELSKMAGTRVDLKRPPNRELQDLAAQFVTRKSADEMVEDVEWRDERLKDLVQQFEETKAQDMPLEMKIEKYNELLDHLIAGVSTQLTLPQLGFIRSVTDELIKLQGRSAFGTPTKRVDMVIKWSGPGWYGTHVVGAHEDEHTEVERVTSGYPNDRDYADRAAREEYMALFGPGWFNSLEELKRWGEQNLLSPESVEIIDYSEE